MATLQETQHESLYSQSSQPSSGPHDNEVTEYTGLLQAHNGEDSASHTMYEGNEDRFIELGAATNRVDRMPLVRKVIFCAILMLPMWILIGFLIATSRQVQWRCRCVFELIQSRVAQHPEGHIVVVALLCVIAITLCITYLLCLALIHGD